MASDTLFPEIINTRIPIVEILPTGSKYGTVAISITGEIYSFNSIRQEPHFTKIKLINFNEPCKRYISNAELPYLCGTGVRDFQVVDLEKLSIEEQVIHATGNDRFFYSYLFNSNEPILLMTFEHIGWTDKDHSEITYKYDFKNRKVVKVIDNYIASLWFQLNDTFFLREDMQVGNTPSLWNVLKMDLNEKITNNLTDTLAKFAPRTYKNFLNMNKKSMIFSTLDSNYTHYTLTWDSLFEDISVTPWTFQRPKGVILGKDFNFDLKGDWLRNTACLKENMDVVYNVFYHVSDGYPGKISIPIFGEKTNWGSTGTFLETPEWGTVYVDLSEGINGILYVYKMRDVMEKIIKRATEMK